MVTIQQGLRDDGFNVPMAKLCRCWATDLCRIWGGRDGGLTLALVIDCYTRQLLGWHLSRTGKASTAAAALEQALITRFGVLGRVPRSFLLRSGSERSPRPRHTATAARLGPEG